MAKKHRDRVVCVLLSKKKEAFQAGKFGLIQSMVVKCVEMQMMFVEKAVRICPYTTLL